MKKMRKIFAVLLTLAMILGMSMTSFAADTTATINLSGDTLTKDTVIKYLQIVEPDTTSTLGWKFSSDEIANVFTTNFGGTKDEALQKVINLGADNHAATGTINASSELGAALSALTATNNANITTTTDGVPNAITNLNKAGLYLVTANATGYSVHAQ